MSLLTYCGCGCAWNPGWFTDCPKCSDGQERAEFDPFHGKEADDYESDDFDGGDWFHDPDMESR